MIPNLLGAIIIRPLATSRSARNQQRAHWIAQETISPICVIAVPNSSSRNLKALSLFGTVNKETIIVAAVPDHQYTLHQRPLLAVRSVPMTAGKRCSCRSLRPHSAGAAQAESDR